MKKPVCRIISLISVFFLTACGYSLRETYDGNAYDSPEFAENYYRSWSSDIDYKNSKNKITNKDVQTKILDKEQDKVFTKYSDENFSKLEPNNEKYTYEYDRTAHMPEDIDKECYGPAVRLGETDKSFRYGYVSKLFDGQFFCNGDFEQARVQIDEGGFGYLFSKEYSLPSNNRYFAINFKGAVEFRRNWSTINIPSHTSDIELTVSFYLKNKEGYERVPVSYRIDNVPTNTGDMPGSREDQYVFFGFELNKNIKIERCAGISIEYTLLNDDTLAQLNEDKFASNPLQHSLLLYEIVMPGSIWH